MAKRLRRMETPAVVQATPRIDARFAVATRGNEKRAPVQQRPSDASRRRPPDFTVLTGTNCPRRRSPVGGALHCSGTYRCRARRAQLAQENSWETVGVSRTRERADSQARAQAFAITSAPGASARVLPGRGARVARYRHRGRRRPAPQLRLHRAPDPRRHRPLVGRRARPHRLEHRRIEADRDDRGEPRLPPTRRLRPGRRALPLHARRPLRPLRRLRPALVLLASHVSPRASCDRT
jgi:hypothetical protein